MAKTAPVSDDVQKDWEKATEYQLTDSDIERAKLLIGIDLAVRHQEYVGTAQVDNIRNFASGVGNDNPLHRDPDYAAGTRWGQVIAPTMMAGIINTPLKGDPMPDEIKAGTKSLFRGIHVFVSGGEWEFYNPIYPGDTLYSFKGEESVSVNPSEFAGRNVIQISREVKFNQRQQVVGVYKTLRILTERKTAAKKGKYSAIEPQSYSDEDIAKIDEIYENEKVRGAEKRYYEDVEIGETLGTMAKGPLTVTDVVCFHAGGYGFVPYAPTVARMAYKNRKRIAPFYVKNEYGIPDVAQRLHWDPAWAQQIGNPMAYDYGVMRENYIYHYLTDWCGDDGWVMQLYDEIRKFNYMGDVQTITGEVVGKREEDGLKIVDVSFRMTNQRGEQTLKGHGSILLPSRETGIPALPAVPADLQAKVNQMWARHNELRSAKR